MLRQITGGASSPKRRSTERPTAQRRLDEHRVDIAACVRPAADGLVAETPHGQLEERAHVVVRLCDQDARDHAAGRSVAASASSSLGWPRCSGAGEHVDEHEARREQSEEDAGRAGTGGRRSRPGCAAPSRRRCPAGFGRQTSGAVRLSPLHDEAVLGVAADDPVDHLRARHRVALRHAVGDELARRDSSPASRRARDRLCGTAAACSCPETRTYAGVAAERLRAQVLRPEETHEDGDRDPGRLVRARRTQRELSAARRARTRVRCALLLIVDRQLRLIRRGSVLGGRRRAS